LSPLAERLLPMSGPAFMHAAGVIEIVVGLAILTRPTRVGVRCRGMAPGDRR